MAPSVQDSGANSHFSCETRSRGTYHDAPHKLQEAQRMKWTRVTRWIVLCSAFLTTLATRAETPSDDTPSCGPAKGTLVIIGGGVGRGTGIIETFVNRAGGVGAKIVIVPTSGGNYDEAGNPIVYREEDVVGRWKQG